MDISILTFDGFNEIDSFFALNILSRVEGFKVFITSPTELVTSMNGVIIHAQQSLEYANGADAVLFGSGVKTSEIIKDASILSRLSLNPEKQLVGSQCSGALIMSAMGLLDGIPVCTDEKSKPLLENAGVRVLGKPFSASGNIASSGGCLSSLYLSAWVAARLLNSEKAATAIARVAPVGEREASVSHCMSVIGSSI